MRTSTGVITQVSGPLVTAKGLYEASIRDICRVGELGLIGEIIEMHGEEAFIQVYEETSGLKPGEKVIGLGEPLSVELGPGLLTRMFDGIQRPLQEIMEETQSDFIGRGVEVDILNRSQLWEFEPRVSVGDQIEPGDVIGVVQETSAIEHRVMVPPYVEGGVVKSIEQGSFTVVDVVATLETEKGELVELTMMQRWPVRQGRPFKNKTTPKAPLRTGQRVIDTFFPITKGGVAAIPGPFGAGKTVVQHQIAKFSDVDVVVYVGCGERGNEMTEVINEFPHLIDPNTGKSLMERTVLIANTSNMPVAAREASIYTGITLAEYFRDMGYSVAIMADSTSRWAEALREMSGRLEEMPGDEGYPAYLGSRIAEYYERAGFVEALGSQGREGSVSAISAVSPAGGDTSEPVTQNTLRVVNVFWSLDSALSQKRHFPAINWLDSYSLYSSNVRSYYNDRLGVDWGELVQRAITLLQEEDRLQSVVQLVGIDSLSEADRMTLAVSRMIREDYLQQNAYDPVDESTSEEKQVLMLQTILDFEDQVRASMKLGAYYDEIMKGTMDLREQIVRMKYVPEDELDRIRKIQSTLEVVLKEVLEKGGAE